MLYKNEIYRLYLELIEKKQTSKNNKFVNVMFDLCDYPGGCGELSAFVRHGNLCAFEDGTWESKWLWTANMYRRINPNRITIRVSEPSLLRELMFKLDDWAKEDGYDGLEDVFYIEHND